jgi:GTP cyclohydrolase I
MKNKSVADKIRERISAAQKKWDEGKREGYRPSFRANDNIAEFIEDGELNALKAEIECGVKSILENLVIDIENDHNTKETARRVAKMWIEEVFGGRYEPIPRVTAFPNVGYDGLYTCGPISIRSTCAHHFQNIVGKCWVGVIPHQEVIGLSKFNRIVYHIAERPQIQEEMTTQIADALQLFANTADIAVVIKAEHHCMLHRGVKEHESDMTTAVLYGRFLTDHSLKQEFYDIIFRMKGHS